MFTEMFKRALNNGEIVRDTHNGPTALFNNTKSRLEYVMKRQGVEDTSGEFDILRDEAAKETVEGVRQRRLIERNPSLVRKLNAIDQVKPKLAKLEEEKKEDDNDTASVGAVFAVSEEAQPYYHEVRNLRNELETMKNYLARLELNPPKLLPLTHIPRDQVYHDWKESQIAFGFDWLERDD